MATQFYQGPTCPAVDDDPQILMWHWFWQVATPEQRAAAIEATTQKLEEDKDDDRQINE